ncbi:amidohydrolase [Mesobacterium pallidum]|uniref:amidohydrolase n=1 Tax=Mesobacterium pallidum TaxID=2872037 RepID=UPI001EE29283|nr:amidohydrolase [Mesobacterium pallidum]
MPITLPDTDLARLTAWRRASHRAPELSGAEAGTAARVVAELGPAHPDRVVTGLGGHGVAAVWDSGAPGPSVLVRCELDALPIVETGAPDWASQIPGVAHLCGHDGHMAILLAVARWLGRNRPARGRAILLFQPAEETGAGSAAVLADPRMAQLRYDLALSLHNMPGMPLGHVRLAPGAMNCASRGMRIRLTGRTAHASDPATGLPPTPALARLALEMPLLAREQGPEDEGFRLVTITHLSVGEPAFGIAPGTGELWATLRTRHDDAMAALVAEAEAMVAAAAGPLGTRVTYHDIFDHCDNAPEAVAVLDAAIDAEALPRATFPLPMRASEDFGRFGQHAPSAMFLLGSGPDCPVLHAPDYDFPDALIEPGARVFCRALSDLLL